jgi:hypothetical protein
MATNKNTNKNVINIHIGDKTKKKKKRKSNKARRRSDQPLTIVNSTNNAPPMNFYAPPPSQSPPFDGIHPAVLHRNRSQVPDLVSQAERENNMRVNNVFQDIQQQQRSSIVDSILNNDNNETNTIQAQIKKPKVDLWEGSFNNPLLDQIKETKAVQKADEYYKQKLLNKGINTLSTNKVSSQTERYNEIKGDIHYQSKQLKPSEAFNKFKVPHVIGMSPQDTTNPLDQSFYKEIKNPSIPDESALIQSIKTNTKRIEDDNSMNRKRFTSPLKLDFTPEAKNSMNSESSALSLLQSSSESTQFTPLQLTETRKKLKPVVNTKEAIKDLEKYLQQEELEETMTPEKSKKVVTNLERFLNEEQLNTSDSLHLPNKEYKINLADNQNENEPIDLTKFKDPHAEDQKVKEANAKYEKALRQQKRMEDEQRLKARKDVLSSQQNPALDLQGVKAEQKKKDSYFKAQINNRFSGYGTEPLKYVKENYENDFDKLKIWAENNPNDRLGPKSNQKLWKLYIDYLYSSSISNKHPGPSIKSSTLLSQIDELKPSLQKNLKLFKNQGDAKITSYSNRGIVTIADLPTSASKPEVTRSFGELLPKQSNQLVRVAK